MSLTLTQAFLDIADAIRAKTGSSATMTPAEMPTEIASISGGGGSGYIPVSISATITVQGVE